MLDGLSKEELVRKVVSVEFSRFLEYYRNAPDLNRSQSESREEQGSSKRFRDRDVDFVRFFINQGKKDGFNPKALLNLINESMPGKSPEIGQIEIMKMFSFFELEAKHAKDLVNAMRQAKFKGRKVQVEESKPKRGGGGGGGGGGKRRRRR